MVTGQAKNQGKCTFKGRVASPRSKIIFPHYHHILRSTHKYEIWLCDSKKEIPEYSVMDSLINRSLLGKGQLEKLYKSDLQMVMRLPLPPLLEQVGKFHPKCEWARVYHGLDFSTFNFPISVGYLELYTLSITFLCNNITLKTLNKVRTCNKIMITKK